MGNKTKIDPQYHDCKYKGDPNFEYKACAMCLYRFTCKYIRYNLPVPKKTESKKGMSNKTTGTGEWAYKNLNTYKGCPNGCTYCYAFRMAKRFKRVDSMGEWLNITESHGDKERVPR